MGQCADFCFFAIAVLLQLYPDHVNDRNDDQETPLHLAADRDTIEELLRCGAKVGVKDAAGLTPCERALQRGDVVIARELALRMKDEGLDAPDIPPAAPASIAVGQRMDADLAAPGLDDVPAGASRKRKHLDDS